jgi:hypothetical protein
MDITEGDLILNIDTPRSRLGDGTFRVLARDPDPQLLWVQHLASDQIRRVFKWRFQYLAAGDRELARQLLTSRRNEVLEWLIPHITSVRVGQL